MSELFFIGFVSAIVFAIIGTLIAENKRVAPITGALLGFFLGPIGLIIVALLNPTLNTIKPSDKFYGDRQLSSDSYRLWLTDKYRISRNETLGRYVIDGNSFLGVEEALRHADHLESLQIENDDIDAERAAAGRKRILYGLAAVAGCIAVFMAAKVLIGYIQHGRAVQIATQAIKERHNTIESTLKRAGLILIPSALMTDRDLTKLSVEDLNSQSFIYAMRGSPSGDVYDGCSVEVASVSTTDISGDSINFMTRESPSSVLRFYKRNLTEAGYTASNIFKSQIQDRLEYRNERHVVFVYTLQLDNRPTIVGICILGRAAMDKIGANLSSYNARMAAAKARVDAADRALRRQLGMSEEP